MTDDTAQCKTMQGTEHDFGLLVHRSEFKRSLQTPTEQKCFESSQIYVTRDRETGDRRHPCRSPFEYRCAAYRIAPYLRAAEREFGHWEEVAVAVYDPDANKALAAARRRASAKQGLEISQMLITRVERVGLRTEIMSNGKQKVRPVYRDLALYVVSARPVGPTPDVPWQVMSGAEGLEWARTDALVLPGVRRKGIRFVGMWGLYETRYDPETFEQAWGTLPPPGAFGAGDLHPAEVERVYEDADDEAEERWGCRPSKSRLPEEIPVADWVAILAMCADRVKDLRAVIDPADVADLPYQDLGLPSVGQSGDTSSDVLPNQAAAALASALDPHVPTPRSGTLETEVVADVGA